MASKNKKSKEKIYYHATSYDNLGSILLNGIYASKYDGLVYMTEKEEDAVKFVLIRGIKHIVTFKIKVKDSSKVIQTFDHSKEFFKCDCYGYIGDVGPDMIEPSSQYKF